LEKSIQAIDALFLILDEPPPCNGTVSDLEYLYALRVASQAIDESVNRRVILGFIQYRWSNRFSILRLLLDSIRDVTSFFKVSELLLDCNSRLKLECLPLIIHLEIVLKVYILPMITNNSKIKLLRINFHIILIMALILKRGTYL
jgi:hypothetical protein